MGKFEAANKLGRIKFQCWAPFTVLDRFRLEKIAPILNYLIYFIRERLQRGQCTVWVVDVTSHCNCNPNLQNIASLTLLVLVNLDLVHHHIFFKIIILMVNSFNIAKCLSIVNNCINMIERVILCTKIFVYCC